MFQGLEVPLTVPVLVQGRLTTAGPGQYYWRGQVQTAVVVECRRCLTEVTVPVTAPMELLFTEAEVPDEPSVQVIPRHAVEVDLTDVVREECILALPEFVLCREDCRGICPRCGADLNAGPCHCAPQAEPGGSVFKALSLHQMDRPFYQGVMMAS
jgi:uncharacterized protein